MNISSTATSFPDEIFPLFKTLALERSVTDKVISAVFNRVIALQQKLEGETWDSIDPNGSFPYRVIVDPSSMYVCVQKIGQGGFSDVYKAAYLTPGQPIEFQAVKICRRTDLTYSPEVKLIRRIMSENVHLVDFPIRHFRANGVSHSVHRLYEGSFREYDYNATNTPCRDLASMLLGAAKGMYAFHQKGHVLRDLKGANVLYMKFEDRSSPTGVLTDFGLIEKAVQGNVPLAGTAVYWDPSIFGSAECSLINQRQRRGTLSARSDMYAFGRMIEKDGLINLLLLLGRKYGKAAEVRSLFAEIRSKTIKGPFSKDLLIELGSRHPQRAIYDDLRFIGKQPVIRVFAPLEKKREVFARAIELFEGELDVDQLVILHQLLDVAMNLQEARRPPSVRLVV